MPHALTPRALNRALLARQLLLQRDAMRPLRAIERLVGMQAQWARPPFVGLWTRLAAFRREHLLKLVRDRQVVRATTMRGTLHLMTAKDYAAFRAALQPGLTLGTQAILRGRADSLDDAALLADARRFFATPRTFEAYRDHLVARRPKDDARALAYIVRTHLPLVQAPDDAAWGWPTVSAFALAADWIETPMSKAGSLAPLVLRYLAAYGPATAVDFATWSGAPPPAAREAFDALRPKLVALPLPRNRETFDLPKGPRLTEDVTAPVRLLPEFDGMLLAHADRSRIVPEAYRRAVFLPGLRVAPTFLVDGFVAGTWAAERKGKEARLALTPFAALARGDRDALAAEAKALGAFLEPDAAKLDVAFAKRSAKAG